jgi:transposase
MIKINFSKEEINLLHYERYHHPHPRVQQKMEALYLKSQGLAHQDICRIVRITKSTLVSYLNDYIAGGIEKLKEINFNQPHSELEIHAPTLKDYFDQHPPATIAEAQSKIEERTGIERSPTQIRAFLKRMGMKCRKVGAIPGKAITDEKIKEQEVFKQQELEPRIKEAREGKRVLFLLMLPILYMAPF